MLIVTYLYIFINTFFFLFKCFIHSIHLYIYKQPITLTLKTMTDDG